jgi:hypothetical protein
MQILLQASNLSEAKEEERSDFKVVDVSAGTMNQATIRLIKRRAHARVFAV